MTDHERDADDPLSPFAHIERLISEGRISRDVVQSADRYWHEHLQESIVLPNGEHVMVTRRSFYHLIADGRIARKPWRVAMILRNVFAIHAAKWGRREAFSRWREEEQTLVGYAILDPDGGVRTIHIVTPTEQRRKMKQGERLWRR